MKHPDQAPYAHDCGKLTAYLAGKGPSLLTYDWSQANFYRFGLNEAAYHVPECLAAIASDRLALDDYAKNLPEHITVYRPILTKGVYHFKKNRYYDIEKKPTAVRALIIFKQLGFTNVHMIGFDSRFGDHSYADIPTLLPPPKDYDKVNMLIDETASELKLEVTYAQVNT